MRLYTKQRGNLYPRTGIGGQGLGNCGRNASERFCHSNDERTPSAVVTECSPSSGESQACSIGNLEEGVLRGSVKIDPILPTGVSTLPSYRDFKPKVLLRPERSSNVGKGMQLECALKRPCRRYVCPERRTDYVLIMAHRNYKVYADIGLSKSLLSRRLAVLDTGAGPNFTRLSELDSDEPAGMQKACLPDIRDANKRPIKSLGTIKLVVQHGNHVFRLSFIVCTTLASPVVLGCDYFDRFVETIRPKNREVELDEGFTVPI
ncbi:hypothetical protein BWQ96_05995 [Gracilariopsis chorda]|uniref:Retropepsins domain-containing protein n=1 Tax=Gracilariopsis chorda TaxID=448386 RepID=A0A2V3IQ80_9FLOR|nr:hypothetical protein BWQ96_05995 [Gracilariopsis chorda]|eukprot:PXF44214.1 hypothetical protein BWQ96_05995 [Gracilariopsis chorda]